MQAVGTHGSTQTYGPTGLRAYGPTGLRAMPSEGRHSRHSGAPGLDTISDDYGPAESCWRMDLAATAGVRATRMSLLWAGWSRWRSRAEATARCGTAESWPTRQSGAQHSELPRASQST
jgi:hypothetical protein